MSTYDTLRPRSGILGLWDHLVGPGMTRAETILVLSASIIAAIFAAVRISSVGGSPLLTTLAALIGLDLQK